MWKAQKVWEEAKNKGAVKEAYILYNVKAKRPIWDLTDSGYKNLHLIASLWSEILDDLKGDFESEHGFHWGNQTLPDQEERKKGEV